MSDVIEKVESNDGQYRVTLYYDRDCASPREWSNLGKMLTWTRNYNSPDDNPCSSPDDFENWWNGVEYYADSGEIPPKDDPRYVRLPVFMIEHSGVAYSTGDYGDKWDSGQVGWIFTTPEGIEECGTAPEYFADALNDEVETYSQWANGSCYGYMVEEKVETCSHCHASEWEEVDSCWGFIGAYPIDDILSSTDLPADLVEKVRNF